MLVCCCPTLIHQLGFVDQREVCFAWPQPIDVFIYFFFAIDKDEKFFLELVTIKQGLSDNIRVCQTTSN